jgi:2-oxoglutarate ferredoxin oxidoreductase subunit beta
MNPMGEKYLRKDSLPFLWCPGCGNGTILAATVRAIDRLGILDDVALIGGIGCSGWIPVYIKADVFHVLHGRTMAFGTGMKMSNPKRKVIVFTGDGDCLGIGGNHFIHAARRNLDMTVLMVNNQIYGMTGGQVAPTTPLAAKTKTSFFGNPEDPFDACELAKAAGATYVARCTAAHPVSLTSTIVEAVTHEGFSFVEVIAQCPTQAGRLMYGISDPGTLLDSLTEQTISVKTAQGKSEEELHGKFTIGKLFQDKERMEFTKRYFQMVQKSGGNT